MSKVHLLPDNVISKIAAGEVIERPASVVKELLENSLDAKATDLEIHLNAGGKTSIRIKDNGSGIEPDDIEKIFLRHSTSKIQSFEELFTLNSLGFRGEALYSIAAISDIILQSKTKDHDTGWVINMRGLEKVQMQPIAIDQGTDIEVRGLFFNTPARRKFLKSDSTELNQILDIVIPYAILLPQNRFLLTHNKRTILDLAIDHDHKTRIANTLNLNKNNILYNQKNISQENIALKIYLGDINIKRSRKDMQFLFVNNRPVYSRSISYHLNQIYQELFPERAYPFFAIMLDIDPKEVDVNIHPTKREVKIKNETLVISILRSLCQETLKATGTAKQITQSQIINSFLKDSDTSYNSYVLKEPADYTLPAWQNHQASTLEVIDQPSPKNNLKDKFSSARYLGQLLKKYLLFQTSNSLIILDQHACQERITYEELKKQIETNKLEVQNLITPIVIKLSPQEMVTWEIIKDKINTIGFATTLWDKESIAIHSSHRLINDPEIALKNLLAQDQDNERRFDKESLAKRACHGSLKTGYDMTKEQALYLQKQLLSCQEFFTCPHGRPIILEISDSFLNREFLRS